MKLPWPATGSNFTVVPICVAVAVAAAPNDDPNMVVG